METSRSAPPGRAATTGADSRPRRRTGGGLAMRRLPFGDGHESCPSDHAEGDCPRREEIPAVSGPLGDRGAAVSAKLYEMLTFAREKQPLIFRMSFV